MNFRKLYWGEISDPSLYPPFLKSQAKLFALIPAPVNADACLAEAGLSDFEEAEEDLEPSWRELLEKSLDYLEGQAGTRWLLSGRLDLVWAPPVSWLGKLFHFFGKKASPQPTLVDILLYSTWDDNWPATRVAFGPDKSWGLWTSHGHEIIWIWTPQEAKFFEILLAELGSKIPQEKIGLKWEKLI